MLPSVSPAHGGVARKSPCVSVISVSVATGNDTAHRQRNIVVISIPPGWRVSSFDEQAIHTRVKSFSQVYLETCVPVHMCSYKYVEIIISPANCSNRCNVCY